MSIINDVVPKNKYKHLSLEQRVQIKTLKDHGKSQTYIAKYNIRNTTIKDIGVKDLIDEIQTYGLDQADAVRLFVLVAGLPTAGLQSYDGERCNVGNYGYFAFSSVQGGKVECLWFDDDNAWLHRFSAGNAMSSFRASDH